MKYEVGKFYKIPHVFSIFYSSRMSKSPWVPVLLPAHEDADLIEGLGLHFHYDFRFTIRAEEVDFGRVKRVIVPLSDVEIRYIRKKCRREMPQNYPHRLTTWFGKLQEQHKCAKLKNGICPHRGIDLTGCGDSERVVCPAHGLTWNQKTGELIELTGWKNAKEDQG